MESIKETLKFLKRRRRIIGVNKAVMDHVLQSADLKRIINAEIRKANLSLKTALEEALTPKTEEENGTTTE